MSHVCIPRSLLDAVFTAEELFLEDVGPSFGADWQGDPLAEAIVALRKAVHETPAPRAGPRVKPMAKLSKAQRRILERISDGNPRGLTAWTLGTVASEALRKRGFVEGEHRFTGRFGNDPILRITAAGLSALAATEGK